MSRIRRARGRDAAALADLAERTFREAFGDLNTPEDVDLHCLSTFGEGIQAREIAAVEMSTLVCEQSGALIAYGQLGWGEAPACVLGSNPAEIRRLYVDQQWHGKGIAQALMTALLDRAAAGGSGVAWLGVWERNPRAIAFYSKCGFVEAGDHTFVLGRDPQRDLVLTKSLL